MVSNYRKASLQMLKSQSLKSWCPGGHISKKAIRVLFFLLPVAAPQPCCSLVCGNIPSSPCVSLSACFLWLLQILRSCQISSWLDSTHKELISKSAIVHGYQRLGVHLFFLGDCSSTHSRLETKEACLSLLPFCLLRGMLR